MFYARVYRKGVHKEYTISPRIAKLVRTYSTVVGKKSLSLIYAKYRYEYDSYVTLHKTLGPTQHEPPTPLASSPSAHQPSSCEE